MAQLPPQAQWQGQRLGAEPAWSPLLSLCRAQPEAHDGCSPVGPTASPRRNRPVLRLPRLVLRDLMPAAYGSHDARVVDWAGLQMGAAPGAGGGPYQDVVLIYCSGNLKNSNSPSTWRKG